MAEQLFEHRPRIGDQRLVAQVVNGVGVQAFPVQHQPLILAEPMGGVGEVERIRQVVLEMVEIDGQRRVARIADGVDDAGRAP